MATVPVEENSMPLCEELARRAYNDERIGIAIGTFPLIHGGAIRFLKEARANCDTLVALILMDPQSLQDSTGGIMASGLLKPDERGRLLASLRTLDAVQAVDEPQALLTTWSRKLPDARWYANAAEKDLPEGVREMMDNAGIKINFLHQDEPCTTQALVRRMGGHV
ncbi:MAG: hypothetical protein ACLFUS_11235 [Candidatus Sumerlaeia bacterium]